MVTHNTVWYTVMVGGHQNGAALREIKWLWRDQCGFSMSKSVTIGMVATLLRDVRVSGGLGIRNSRHPRSRITVTTLSFLRLDSSQAEGEVV